MQSQRRSGRVIKRRTVKYKLRFSALVGFFYSKSSKRRRFFILRTLHSSNSSNRSRILRFFAAVGSKRTLRIEKSDIFKRRTEPLKLRPFYYINIFVRRMKNRILFATSFIWAKPTEEIPCDSSAFEEAASVYTLLRPSALLVVLLY
jgi:hypothetical protein